MGAATIFERAGFRVCAQEQWGDDRLATGIAMGFGAGDFEREYLRTHLRQNWTGLRWGATQFNNHAAVFANGVCPHGALVRV